MSSTTEGNLSPASYFDPWISFLLKTAYYRRHVLRKKKKKKKPNTMEFDDVKK